MSLVKKPIMTEKKLAAIRRNQKLSHGPATVEGKERIGAAQFRHGFYAKAREIALPCLGEDPGHYEELLQGLYEEFTPVGALQEELVIRLARVLWLVDRYDRSQEGKALRRAQEVNSGREERLHARMMRFKITAERLRRLAESVAEEHYVTTPEDLEKMKILHEEGVLKDMGEIALILFYQLQVPGGDENGLDPYEVAHRMAAQAKAIFGIGTNPPSAPPANALKVGATENADLKVSATSEQDKRYPSISAAEWEKRERPRQLLENILTRQMEVCEDERKALLRESLKGPSPYERAAEIAPSPAEALLMRRVQDANLREVRRLTNLLLKIQRQERYQQSLEDNNEGVV